MVILNRRGGSGYRIHRLHIALKILGILGLLGALYRDPAHAVIYVPAIAALSGSHLLAK